MVRQIVLSQRWLILNRLTTIQRDDFVPKRASSIVSVMRPATVGRLRNKWDTNGTRMAGPKAEHSVT